MPVQVESNVTPADPSSVSNAPAPANLPVAANPVASPDNSSPAVPAAPDNAPAPASVQPDNTSAASPDVVPASAPAAAAPAQALPVQIQSSSAPVSAPAKSLAAPLDHYFGSAGMSSVGMSNDIMTVDSNRPGAAATLKSLSNAENAFEDMSAKYPNSPDNVKLGYWLYQDYKHASTDTSDAASAALCAQKAQQYHDFVVQNGNGSWELDHLNNGIDE
jgi:hypothetical protein